MLITEKENCLKQIRVTLINYRISANYTKNKQKKEMIKRGTQIKKLEISKKIKNNRGKPITAERYFLDMINKLMYL